MARREPQGGVPVKLDAREVEPGVFSVLVEERSYEVRVEGEQCTWRGRTFSTTPPEVAAARARRGGGAARIQSTMPGKVIRVLVQVGETVVAGQGIVVVEAMKMQNEMKSPRNGVVKTLRAEAGGTIGAGDLIALIE
jgi:biotin carboxyl carrier protein